MISQSLRIVGALVARDIKIMTTGFFDRFINYALFMFFQAIVFGYLTPLMGMPIALVPPLFLGTLIFAVTAVCFSRSIAIMSDINFGHHILYELGLPMQKSWLILRYIASLMIEFFIISAPLLPIGKLYLGGLLDLSAMRIMPLLILYFFSLLFFATFFLALVVLFDFHWYLDNIWPRVLSPIELFGCVFYTWSGVYSISPIVAQIMRVNPIVAMSEGLRAALLTPEMYLPVSQCIMVLLVWSAVSVMCIHIGLKRRLDPI